MREMEFRAWIKSLKMMLPVHRIEFDIEQVYVWHDGMEDHVVYDFNEVELMQWTGLRDKNEEKVFEGDIVDISKCWWDASGPAGIGEEKTIVKWNEEYNGFSPFCIYDCDCGVYFPAEDVEVIGNIHEGVQ